MELTYNKTFSGWKKIGNLNEPIQSKNPKGQYATKQAYSGAQAHSEEIWNYIDTTDNWKSYKLSSDWQRRFPGVPVEMFERDFWASELRDMAEENADIYQTIHAYIEYRIINAETFGVREHHRSTRRVSPSVAGTMEAEFKNTIDSLRKMADEYEDVLIDLIALKARIEE